jgi:Holliday junction resolvase-like predicted endonuclease
MKKCKQVGPTIDFYFGELDLIARQISDDIYNEVHQSTAQEINTQLYEYIEWKLTKHLNKQTVRDLYGY